MPDVHDKYEHLNEPLLEFLTINLLTVTNPSQIKERNETTISQIFFKTLWSAKDLGTLS